MHENELKEPSVSKVSADIDQIWHKAKRGEYWGKEGAIALAEDSLDLRRWVDGNADDFYRMAYLYYSAAKSAVARLETHMYLNPVYLYRYQVSRRKAKRFMDVWWTKVSPDDVVTPKEAYVRAQILSLNRDPRGAIDVVNEVLKHKPLSCDAQALLHLALAEAQVRLGDESAAFTYKKTHGLAGKSGAEVQVLILSSYAYFLAKHGNKDEDKKTASTLVQEAWERATLNGLDDEVQKLKPILFWIGFSAKHH